MDQWLEGAATENGCASPYIRGDGNLDGFVDVRDFNIWNENKFSSTLLWNGGNFNGDASADVSDFNIWNEHKFTASDGVAAIPEPGGLALLIPVLLAFLYGNRAHGKPAV